VVLRVLRPRYALEDGVVQSLCYARPWLVVLTRQTNASERARLVSTLQTPTPSLPAA
jgi:hypothetical protein